MSCTPDITTADLAEFRAAVHRKCPWDMSYADREEVVGDILLAAVKGSAATGIPVVKLAFAYLKRGRFFTRPARRVVRNQAELVGADPLDEGGATITIVEVEAAASHETNLELQDLVDRLPQPEKKVFVLCMRWRYTLAEAAVALGIPVSTAHLQLARAREQLRGGWLMAQAV